MEAKLPGGSWLKRMWNEEQAFFSNTNCKIFFPIFLFKPGNGALKRWSIFPIVTQWTHREGSFQATLISKTWAFHTNNVESIHFSLATFLVQKRFLHVEFFVCVWLCNYSNEAELSSASLHPMEPWIVPCSQRFEHTFGCTCSPESRKTEAIRTACQVLCNPAPPHAPWELVCPLRLLRPTSWDVRDGDHGKLPANWDDAVRVSSHKKEEI